MSEHALPPELAATIVAEADPVHVSAEALQVFVDEASRLGHRPAEALRRLAIALEHRELAAGWATLARVYDVAEEIDPTDVRIPHSRTVSAENFDGTEVRADEWAAVLRAEALSPTDADVLYSKGLCQYRDHGTLEEALQSFDRSLAYGGGPMAQLFRGHCLQDLERWVDAASAYLAVDVDRLMHDKPQWTWRRWLRDALVAQCELASGRVEEARQRAVDLVRDLHDAPTDDTSAAVVVLEQIVGELGDADLARELAILELQA